MAEALFPNNYTRPPNGGAMGMGDLRTMDEVEQRETVRNLHPEFWRRFKALMIAAEKVGIPLGVGTGWRIQPCCGKDSSGRCVQACSGFALPGNSNHEGFPADGEHGNAVAIDTVIDTSWEWMEGHLAEYGLRSFNRPSSWGYSGSDEPWHIQPVEIPASRSFRSEPWTLPRFDLPGIDKVVFTVEVTLELVKKGTNTPDARKCKGLLKSFGIPGRYSPATNGFGPAAEKALKAFQQAKGLQADGICGPMTWTALLETRRISL